MSALAARVRPQTTRESLGGPWTTDVRVWLILLMPALVMSGYQDSSVLFPNPLEAALAAVIECAMGILPFVIVGSVRRADHVIPLPLCALFWASVGILHGVTAGFLADQFAGAPPNYAERATYWAAACLIWLPLATYAVAQFANRRQLWTALTRATLVETQTREDSLREAVELRSHIVGVMQDSIRPVVLEIAHSLRRAGPTLDAAQLGELATRLSGVSDETTRIIETTEVGDLMPAVEPAPGPQAPIIAAVDFDQTRPVLAALLTVVALLPITIALSFEASSVRAFGLETTAVVLAVAVVVLITGMATLRLTRQRSGPARIRNALAVYAIAGISTALAAYFGPWQPADQQNYVLAILLVLAVPFAAAALSAAAGLGNANISVATQTAIVDSNIVALETNMEGRRLEVRGQLTSLTHGPLRGRLSACAMALNFHAAELDTASPDRAEFIARSVLEHLASALDELDSLG